VRATVHVVVIPIVVGLIVTAITEHAGEFVWIVVLGYVVIGLATELLVRSRAAVRDVVTAGDAYGVTVAIDGSAGMFADATAIDILSGTLRTFTERRANIQSLRERFRDGAAVRILLLAPEGEGIRLLARDRRVRGVHVGGEDLKEEVAQSLRRLLDEFEPAELQAILRLYDGVPHSSVLRCDDRYALTLYTFGRGGSAPALSLQRAGHTAFCQAVDRGFNELWNAKTTVPVDAELIKT
jgi:hypothetical protein